MIQPPQPPTAHERALTALAHEHGRDRWTIALLREQLADVAAERDALRARVAQMEAAHGHDQKEQVP